jgi:hypothetical protein
MSLIGSVANYGGRQPDNFQGIKQFVTASSTSDAQWIYKKNYIDGVLVRVQTPANKKTPLLIENDLYVTGSLYNTSDIRIKQNVVPLSAEKIAAITQLQTVSYNFKNSKETHLGLIAQDVETYFPELVKSNLEGILSVNYSGFVPVLIGKIKELENKLSSVIDKLDKLDEMKLSIEDLENTFHQTI